MGGRSKKQIRKFFVKFFDLSSWKLALVLILLLFVAATALRFDNIRMTRLLDNVMELDANEASDEEILEALNKLQSFALHHIIINRISENGQEKVIFGTGPFYLENQYLRSAKNALTKAQEEASNSTTNPNGNIYQKVASVCDALSKKYGWGFNANYINCWQEEIDKYPATDTIYGGGEAVLPSTELFRHEYLSPVWCFCFSGLVILLSVFVALYLVIRFITWAAFRLAVFVIDRRSQ